MTHRHSNKLKQMNSLKQNKTYGARIDQVEKLRPSVFHKGFKAKVIHQDPYIVKIRRFLNTAETEALLDMAKGLFAPSTTIVNNEEFVSDGRTSHTAFITMDGQKGTYPSPVENLIKRVCYITGCKRKQIEGLMVVRYKENQAYYDHHDYFYPEDVDALENGGQRIGTFFCYLNSLDENDGGETEFPQIGVKVKPSKGTAVFWWNQTPDGKTLPKTLHRGNPVKKGIKYGLNIWIRSQGW